MHFIFLHFISFLNFRKMWCAALLCCITDCNTLQHAVTQCNTLCNTLQHSATYNTLLCCIAQNEMQKEFIGWRRGTRLVGERVYGFRGYGFRV